jgi:hypothetical protein
MPLSLTTRSGKGSALSATEHDDNLDNIQTLVNALETGKADQSAVDTAIATRSPAARSGTGAPTASADEVGQWYTNNSNGDKYQAISAGSGAADWELVSSVSATDGQKLVYDDDNDVWVAETEVKDFVFRVFGTVGTAIDSSTSQFKLPWPWKLTAVRHKVSAGSITVTAKIGEGGTTITGVSALTLNQTSWTSTSVTTGNTGTAAQLFEYGFGTGSSLANLQVQFVFERNGYN